MQIIPFQALTPTLEKIGAPNAFFAAVKEDFPRFVEQGLFESRRVPAVYLYAIQYPSYRTLGIVACTHVQDYLEGAIKRHENTIPAKEAIQIQLWKEQQAMVKPVLLTYPSIPAIEDWMNRMAMQNPVFLNIAFPDEAQSYQIWEISDPLELQYIQELYAAFVPRAYIADGHHRCSSAALMYEQNLALGSADPYFLVAFFPSTHLHIQAFHRLLDGVQWSKAELLEKLNPYFTIEELVDLEAPGQKFELCFLVETEAFRLNWRPEILQRYQWQKAVLDTQLLNEVVLPNVFGIDNIRSEPSIKYIEGAKGMSFLQQEQQRKANRVAFALYPIDVKEMMLLADHDQTLPPKSTWFEPRMKNGIVVKPFHL